MKIPRICPGCAGTRINVKSQGDTGASWGCLDCGAIGRRGYDHPEITSGKRMAADYEGIHAMDEAITHLPCKVQIGILRERQAKEDASARAHAILKKASE